MTTPTTPDAVPVTADNVTPDMPAPTTVTSWAEVENAGGSPEVVDPGSPLIQDMEQDNQTMVQEDQIATQDLVDTEDGMPIELPTTAEPPVSPVPPE